MAFDMYVGTMTRYFRQEWENVAQRMAREQGLTYQMIHAGGEAEPPPPADELREIVAAWFDELCTRLGPLASELARWSEADDEPYFTERPGWEGFAAVQLWASYAQIPQLTRPARMPEQWADDAALKAMHEAPRLGPYGVIVRAGLWLPGSFPFVFTAVDLTNEQTSIGSTGALLNALHDLDRGTFGGRGTEQGRHGEWGEEPTLEQVAMFGFSIFHALASKAVEHRLPLILSF